MPSKRLKHLFLCLALPVFSISFLATASAKELVDTGLFKLNLEPINACYFTKDKAERVQCFGEAVEESWQAVQKVKSEQVKLINSGKSVFVNPFDFDAEDSIVVQAYIRKILCGGPDCTREQFSKFKEEVNAFIEIAGTNERQKIDEIIKRISDNGTDEPKFTEIIFSYYESAPISEVPDSIIEQIKADLAKDHPDDYSVQAALLKREKEAYLSLVNMKRHDGVPADIFSRIKLKLSEDHPGDYSVQLALLKREIESYLELNN